MLLNLILRFERYVNFEFYKTKKIQKVLLSGFERYVNFEFYKTVVKTEVDKDVFERYVNFEFYKTQKTADGTRICLRDM